jgi:hypothetical protein
MNCIRIKRIIDEADRPDVLPLEAAGHLPGCPDCQSFADERAKLRELTGSVGRVTAPNNFNVLLNERLSRVKSGRSSWLSPAGFMRLGTATAGLLVVFMALQYGGFLSSKGPVAVDQPTDKFAGGLQDDGAKDATPAPAPAPAPDVVSVDQDTHVTRRLVAATSRSTARSNTVSISRTPKADRQDGPPRLLVRDSNGDRTMLMFPISVGMQQTLNASLGRQQPRGADTSY